MLYTTFNRKNFNALEQPMFLGEPVNVARYDVQKHKVFENLIEKQLSFFWRPEEVDLSNDRKDFQDLPEHEKHIFLSNLKYQTLLDSVQGRSPNVAFLPVVSLPELETWIETWSFFETIHSRSYTHIMRNVVNDPGPIFDDIVNNEHITRRAVSVTEHYDRFIQLTSYYHLLGLGKHQVNGKEIVVDMKELKRLLYLTVVSVNVLEAIRFYVSFACSFAFAERAKMEGNAKIIKLIARDEALHLTSTQHILHIMARGQDDPDMALIAEQNRDEVVKIFAEAAQQEKEWAEYLFKDGSMIGLNKEILSQYVEYITNQRITALGFEPLFPAQKSNPLPWINAWLNSDNVQVAPQESEITSYLVGAIDSEINTDDLGDFSL